ncbi:topoisomerase DNA-binding C4 zinc finger domain-containing protein, partial [Patescibacteria group bacterium]|nr:topoisomerase DNA-binding C4 zinc finger domain-containing protein [Patescibacteria group bacterium]
PNKEPDSLNLDENQNKLYNLIWRRFTACQMSEAIFDSTSVNIKAGKYTFKSNGQILKFDGFLKVYSINFEETILPNLKEADFLELEKLTPSQHFTQPPARYTEAGLIKILEENAIGRPSTYAPIISTIQARNYVEKNEQKRFIPTEMGLIVIDLLTEHFPEIVDIGFTADLEDKLDKIAEGKEKWEKTLKNFYEPFAKNLENKYKEVIKKETIMEKTDKKCPKCGAELVIRLGRFGKFYACSKFPECKHSESLEQKTLGVKCPKCETGELTEKRTKRKKIFYACNKYPDCDFALWDKPTGKKCEKCGSLMIETKKEGTKCSNPNCS